MKRLFMATLGHETNLGSPIPTGMKAYRETVYFEGDATRHPPRYFSGPLHVWRERAENEGWEVVEGLCAYAEPGGIIPEPVFQDLKHTLLEGLRNAMPVDAVLLNLHGAMVSTQQTDCEAELLRDVRALTGDKVVIGIELDLHAHLTRAMVELSDIAVCYKQYPHTDPEARAGEIFDLVKQQLQGDIAPVMALVDCECIQGSMQTVSGPMADLVSWMVATENTAGILSVSLVHGFPLADVSECGVRALVVADKDAELALTTAKELRDRFWAIKDKTTPEYLAPAPAIKLAANAEGTTLIADSHDNPGVGYAGDATFLLNELLQQKKGLDAVVGLMWDPVVVRLATDAGVGSTLDVRLGGKSGPASGKPVDLRVEVLHLSDDHWQTFGQTQNRLGACAHLRVAERNIDILVTSARGQSFHPDALTKLGISVVNRKIIIVKSSTHFLAGFSGVGDRIWYVDNTLEAAN